MEVGLAAHSLVSRHILIGFMTAPGPLVEARLCIYLCGLYDVVGRRNIRTCLRPGLLSKGTAFGQSKSFRWVDLPPGRKVASRRHLRDHYVRDAQGIDDA